MSGPSPLPAPSDDPALDAHVLADGPLLEIGGWHAVASRGGAAVLAWRGAWLQARAAGVEVLPAEGLGRHARVLVRIGRGRTVTQADLALGLGAVASGGELAVTGPNDLGIGSWVRRLAEHLGKPVRVHIRAKARVAVFAPAADATLPQPASTLVPAIPGGPAELRVDPGVFSPGGLDPGTALLLDHLHRHPCHGRVVDLGCGAGHLAINSLRDSDQATALLADADARAVACAQANLITLGLAARAEVRWWDASEALPESSADLVLVNPPAHEGIAVSVGPALAMLRMAAVLLAPGGRLLVVANQRLPYERELSRIAPWRLALETHGYKILEVQRPGGSADGGSA